VVISESKAVATAVKGMNTITFGNINAVVFESLELALSYVRMNAA
jgi:ATP-dependent Lon protease